MPFSTNERMNKAVGALIEYLVSKGAAGEPGYPATYGDIAVLVRQKSSARGLVEGLSKIPIFDSEYESASD